MIIVETTPQKYDQYFGKGNICYNSAAFNELNAFKCNEVFFLLFKDSKLRLGLVAGLKGKILLSPFSSPFGGFSTVDNTLSVRHIEEAVEALKIFCKSKGFESLSMTLPPLFYNESFLTKVQHVLIQKDFRMDALDLNYYFHLKQILNNYSVEVLARNARKNLNIALSKNLSFRAGSGEQDLMLAYDIIKRNREEKGFYISMTADEMIRTSKLLKADSFMVGMDGQDIASAIVFHVTEKILQVIYWGDLSEFASNKTMNYLSFKVFEFYYLKNYTIIDVGTAMLDNKPNYGLCDFKESIGCVIQPKCTFSIDFTE